MSIERINRLVTYVVPVNDKQFVDSVVSSLLAGNTEVTSRREYHSICYAFKYAALVDSLFETIPAGEKKSLQDKEFALNLLQKAFTHKIYQTADEESIAPSREELGMLWDMTELAEEGLTDTIMMHILIGVGEAKTFNPTREPLAGAVIRLLHGYISKHGKLHSTNISTETKTSVIESKSAPGDSKSTPGQAKKRTLESICEQLRGTAFLVRGDRRKKLEMLLDKKLEREDSPKLFAACLFSLTTGQQIMREDGVIETTRYNLSVAFAPHVKCPDFHFSQLITIDSTGKAVFVTDPDEEVGIHQSNQYDNVTTRAAERPPNISCSSKVDRHLVSIEIAKKISEQLKLTPDEQDLKLFVMKVHYGILKIPSRNDIPLEKRLGVVKRVSSRPARGQVVKSYTPAEVEAKQRAFNETVRKGISEATTLVPRSILKDFQLTIDANSVRFPLKIREFMQEIPDFADQIANLELSKEDFALFNSKFSDPVTRELITKPIRVTVAGKVPVACDYDTLLAIWEGQLKSDLLPTTINLKDLEPNYEMVAEWKSLIAEVVKKQALEKAKREEEQRQRVQRNAFIKKCSFYTQEYLAKLQGKPTRKEICDGLTEAELAIVKRLCSEWSLNLKEAVMLHGIEVELSDLVGGPSGTAPHTKRPYTPEEIVLPYPANFDNAMEIIARRRERNKQPATLYTPVRVKSAISLSPMETKTEAITSSASLENGLSSFTKEYLQHLKNLQRKLQQQVLSPENKKLVSQHCTEIPFLLHGKVINYSALANAKNGITPHTGRPFCWAEVVPVPFEVNTFLLQAKQHIGIEAVEKMIKMDSDFEKTHAKEFKFIQERKEIVEFETEASASSKREGATVSSVDVQTTVVTPKDEVKKTSFWRRSAPISSVGVAEMRPALASSGEVKMTAPALAAVSAATAPVAVAAAPAAVAVTVAPASVAVAATPSSAVGDVKSSSLDTSKLLAETKSVQFFNRLDAKEKQDFLGFRSEKRKYFLNEIEKELKHTQDFVDKLIKPKEQHESSITNRIAQALVLTDKQQSELDINNQIAQVLGYVKYLLSNISDNGYQDYQEINQKIVFRYLNNHTPEKVKQVIQRLKEQLEALGKIENDALPGYSLTH